MEEKDSYCIKSVKSALEILEAIGEEDSDVRLSCLSKKVNMHRARLFRFLTTFMEAGYVEQGTKTGRYSLGPSAYSIGQKSLSCMNLVQETRPILERLALECNEAAYLAVAQKQEVLLLDMVDTTQKVAVIRLIGKRVSLSGPTDRKDIQAEAHEKVIGGVKDPLGPAEAQLLMKRGVSVDFGALGDGSIAGTAAPFFSSQGATAGFLCLIGPRFRLSEERIEHELNPRLQDAAQAVSAKLGYRNH
jgi:DNA-binding IclR family transcriptional regulator